jgi:hypothetical protein
MNRVLVGLLDSPMYVKAATKPVGSSKSGPNPAFYGEDYFN